MFGRALSWMSWIFAIGCLAGCATSSSHNFWTRKAKPSTAEEDYANRLRADAKRLADKGDAEGANQLRELARQATESIEETVLLDRDEAINNQPTEVPRESMDVAQNRSESTSKAPSAGGLFDVSSRPSGRVEEFEAPPPKHSSRSSKSLGPSLTFDELIPPADVNLQSPFTVSDATDSEPSSTIDPLAESVADELAAGEQFPTNHSQVTQADFMESGQGPGAKIELAANERTRDKGRITANPWDRLRDLIQPSQRATEPTPSDSNSLPTIQPGGLSNPYFQSSQTTNPPAAVTLPPASGRPNPELWPGRWNQPAGPNGSSLQTAPGFVTPAGVTDRPIDAARPRIGMEPPPLGTQLPRNPASLGLPITTANWPSGVGGFGSLGNSPDLDRLIAVTAGEVAAALPGDTELERQAYLRKHVQLRLLYWIAGQTDRALQPISGVEPTDQEFWQQLLWGMTNYFDLQGMPDSAERATQTIAQLKAASLRLQAGARLELKNVAFCHKISSFGNYQRFKRDEFTPGQPVLLYAEVCNFKSEPTSDGQFRTLMKSTVEILQGSDRGRVIETIPFPPSEDRCRNHRHDYFHSYEFAIPTGLPSGPHVLRMTVEDQLGKKTAVSTLNFLVQ